MSADPSTEKPAQPRPSPGDELPTIAMHITLQRLVMEAGANRDFAPSHFDPEYARARGAPTAFANFDFISGLFERLVREYVGPRGFLELLRFRMHGNVLLGLAVTAGGKVRAVEPDGHGDLVISIDIWQAQEVQTATGLAKVRIRAGGPVADRRPA